jgi:hypothetical protein
MMIQRYASIVSRHACRRTGLLVEVVRLTAVSTSTVCCFTALLVSLLPLLLARFISLIEREHERCIYPHDTADS